VIVLVERDGRALLARNARTKSAFHSLLAGYVEVGESLEECARELSEEAGITVRDIATEVSNGRPPAAHGRLHAEWAAMSS
jgi:NAD+ diphosphatase